MNTDIQKGVKIYHAKTYPEIAPKLSGKLLVQFTLSKKKVEQVGFIQTIKALEILSVRPELERPILTAYVYEGEDNLFVFLPASARKGMS